MHPNAIDKDAPQSVIDENNADQINYDVYYKFNDYKRKLEFCIKQFRQIQSYSQTLKLLII